MKPLTAWRLGWIVLPFLLGITVPYFEAMTWPALLYLTTGLPIFGLTITVLLLSFNLRPGITATLLKSAIPFGFLAAAWFSVWPLLKETPGFWEEIPSEYLIFALIRRFANAVSECKRISAEYPNIAAPVFRTASVAFLAACMAFVGLIVDPIRSHARTNRDSDKGPWVGNWMRPERVKELAANFSGLPLGLHRGNILRYNPNSKRGWRAGHHMVVAGTRAGKGVSCILPAIIDHPGPVVVIDIKGENFAVCRRHRASLGRKQIVLNPFGVIEEKTNCFDPMSYLRSGKNLQRDIATLCEGLIKPEIAEETAWISNGARQILEAAMELVMTEGDADDRSLLAVENLVLGPKALDTFAAWQDADDDLCNGRIAKAGAKICGMGDRQRGAVLDCLSENLEWLKFDHVRNMLLKSDFTIDDLLDDKVDLFLVVPQDMSEKLSNFMRVMMTLALGAVTRQDGRRQAKARILAVLDEFTRLGKMEKVLEIATIAAGGGVEAIFVVQDRGTLDHVYTEDGANTLLGSCATTRIFGIGRADGKTAHWAEEQLPFKTVIRESKSQRGGKEDISRSETRERLMDAPSLQQMPVIRMLCLISSNPPLLIDQIISHNHRDYRRKLDSNPVVRA